MSGALSLFPSTIELTGQKARQKSWLWPKSNRRRLGIANTTTTRSTNHYTTEPALLLPLGLVFHISFSDI